MTKFKRYLIAIVDVALIAVAFGGLLFACSNQESGRQSAMQESAIIQRVVYQKPLDAFIGFDPALWQKALKNPDYFTDGDDGLLLDVRYWEEATDVVVKKILQLGAHVDYINPTNQRIFVWVKNPAQLAGLAKINGVSAVSISRFAPKMHTAIRVFDELQK
ncbi:hypothetical protein [Zhongshania sp. BJYM1]|uniref:hypothetical protein n=1 Tax=Zhongshania aquatica TaxID=2965069 RepID=UPI0022B4711D|nr:hypothetical protein [Marortus sp. BJYM1]